MIEWHIGCSGFQYRHWKPIFYPEKLAQKNWFLYYASHYDTVELNVTFYRFPDMKMVDGWYVKSPPNFIFTVKAPRIITHYKKLNGTEELVADFYNVIGTGLKEKLGCVLFQFPPFFSYSPERLEKIIASVNTSFTNVIEFRHSSWWQTEVYQKLGDHNISFCGMSHPLLPTTILHNTPVLYYRMHGVPDLYRSRYSIEVLHEIVNEISGMQKLQKVYIYFNNDIDGSAIFNSRELIDITG